MKPCTRHRKQLAWLAAGNLESATARDLHLHLESCPGCRSYLAELSKVTGNLFQPASAPTVEASERFHRRVLAALEKERAGQRPVSRIAWRPILLRVALPAFAVVMALAILAVIYFHPTPQPRAESAPQALTRPSVIASELQPTIANYQSVANRSLDELDELVTRQARHYPSQPALSSSTMVAGAFRSE